MNRSFLKSGLQLCRYVISLLLVVFAGNNVFSQIDSVALAKTYLQQADQIYKQQKEAVEVAKELYAEAVKLDTANLKANWMAGFLYLETINKDEALPYLMRLYKLKPRYRFDLLYQIGRAHHYALNFDSAIYYYERYKNKVIGNRSYRGTDRVMPKKVMRRIQECENGREVINRPSEYSITPLGDEINSVWPDYAPVLNREGNLMIFTSRRLKGNTSPDVDKDNFYFEDVFFSVKEDGHWSPAKNIGAPINTQYHDANIYLSANADRLYVYKDTGRGDIYYSDFIDTAWTEPQFLTNKVNSSIYSENSICETANPDIIFYTSNRPGGEGGIDIYYCTKDEKGNWYKSKSLGTTINTSGDEDSPFLAHDGVTLYFSSTGHIGYGGYDIFRSVYDSTSGEWSKPENLGFPINTPDDEISFQMTKGQREGYYASVREGGLGFTDIFRVKYHGENSEPDGGQVLANAPASEGGAPAGEEKKKPVEWEDSERRIIQNTHKIFFTAAESSIREVHRSELDGIVQLMNKYDDLKIHIEGYASKDGNPRYNMQLSQKRALIVLAYFIAEGIPEDRIVARGFGSVKEQTGTSELYRRADVKVIYEGLLR